MTDEDFMHEAILEAKAAARRGEVPVGAILVNAKGEIVARTGNAPIALSDPTAHAEILALRDAAYQAANYRLTDLTLYVTLEPCAMCAGALSHARIKRLVFGAPDLKGGAVESGIKFFESPACHHRPDISSGIRAIECGDLLRSFFKARR
ncbi:MAG: nucleoside deaminase [Hellea sp.]|nr:nucleoside deaminase [Hellea sp.]